MDSLSTIANLNRKIRPKEQKTLSLHGGKIRFQVILDSSEMGSKVKPALRDNMFLSYHLGVIMPIFTPDNEPYLGIRSIYVFDELIIAVMRDNKLIADWTIKNKLTRLQKAASQIIPHGFSIALSIRELIRQGYLFSAEILLRSLIERAAVVSYLIDHQDKLELWEQGWPYKSRPPLHEMLKSMDKSGYASKTGNEELIKNITNYYNSIVHTDPHGADENLVSMDANSVGYSSTKVTNNPSKAAQIAEQTLCFLIVLMARAAQTFPDPLEQHRNTTSKVE